MTQQTNELKWWQKGIIYQIYPRSFKDGNNDGIGDLIGIKDKLDYLVWLGIDAIWLSPIYPSPMEDFGYDISNYTDVHSDFGTLEDFDNLVKKAHQFGLKIIMDFVPNHTSNQHPWFLESKASKNNPKRNWYVWKDSKDGDVPNNWICVPGGSAWEWDEGTNQYYLHSFLTCQPDLNWDNPDVRNAMCDVLRFWLARGVDGFRIDMISWLSKDQLFRDDPINHDFIEGKTFFNFDKLLHEYSKDGPNLFTYLKEIADVINSYPDTVSIGEVDYYIPLNRLVEYYGDGNLIKLPGNFRLIYMNWEAKALSAFINEYNYVLPEYAWPNNQLGNHDIPRIATRLGKKRALLGALMLLTLKGTPFIYYGEELGMENVLIPQEQIMDPVEKVQAGTGRDPERTPMQWNDNNYAGFSQNKPWLPVSPNYRKKNVEMERMEEKSFLNFYQQLISYRKIHDSLLIGKYQAIDNLPDDCYGYYRSYNNERHAILLNLSQNVKIIKKKDLSQGKIIFTSYFDNKRIKNDGIIELNSYEGILIEIG